MTSFEKLNKIQLKNNTRLCVGLDPQMEKLPKPIPKNIEGIFEFNKIIVELTSKFVSAYKLNFAFYEQFGSRGIEILEKTLEIIPESTITIADVKRADIGNTSKAYARAIYEHFKFDCATVNPFLGMDSLEPFFDYKNRLNFVLIVTSNAGSSDFQKLKIDKKYLYEIILDKLLSNFSVQNLGLVVGATSEKEFQKVREIASENFILVPGIGAQGGNLQNILEKNRNQNLLVNVGRDIIFASQDENFHDKIFQRTSYYYEKLKIF